MISACGVLLAELSDLISSMILACLVSNTSRICNLCKAGFLDLPSIGIPGQFPKVSSSKYFSLCLGLARKYPIFTMAHQASRPAARKSVKCPDLLLDHVRQ